MPANEMIHRVISNLERRLTLKTRRGTEAGDERVSSLKREMEQPRLTASVREALEEEAALKAKHPVARPARA
jgi:hypothetical protein